MQACLCGRLKWRVGVYQRTDKGNDMLVLLLIRDAGQVDRVSDLEF